MHDVMQLMEMFDSDEHFFNVGDAGVDVKRQIVRCGSTFFDLYEKEYFVGRYV